MGLTRQGPLTQQSGPGRPMNRPAKCGWAAEACVAAVSRGDWARWERGAAGLGCGAAAVLRLPTLSVLCRVSR